MMRPLIRPPGFFAEGEMLHRGWSPETLAERAGLPLSVITAFLTYGYPMDDRLSAGLARAFHTSTVMWVRLDEQYQRGSAR
jgi:plasmid maintenance system antidote protein VapI